MHPIKSDEQLRRALTQLEKIRQAPAGSPDADRLEILTLLVERYEEANWTAKDLDPVDMLDYAFTDMGRSQAELAALLGSRSRASEIMARKRPLTLDMIRKISAAWNIPLALLVKPYALSDGRPLPLRAPTP